MSLLKALCTHTHTHTTTYTLTCTHTFTQTLEQDNELITHRHTLYFLRLFFTRTRQRIDHTQSDLMTRTHTHTHTHAHTPPSRSQHSLLLVRAFKTRKLSHRSDFQTVANCDFRIWIERIARSCRAVDDTLYHSKDSR